MKTYELNGETIINFSNYAELKEWAGTNVGAKGRLFTRFFNIGDDKVVRFYKRAYEFNADGIVKSISDGYTAFIS